MDDLKGVEEEFGYQQDLGVTNNYEVTTAAASGTGVDIFEGVSLCRSAEHAQNRALGGSRH